MAINRYNESTEVAIATTLEASSKLGNEFREELPRKLIGGLKILMQEVKTIGLKTEPNSHTSRLLDYQATDNLEMFPARLSSKLYDGGRCRVVVEEMHENLRKYSGETHAPYLYAAVNEVKNILSNLYALPGTPQAEENTRIASYYKELVDFRQLIDWIGQEIRETFPHFSGDPELIVFGMFKPDNLYAKREQYLGKTSLNLDSSPEHIVPPARLRVYADCAEYTPRSVATEPTTEHVRSACIKMQENWVIDWSKAEPQRGLGKAMAPAEFDSVLSIPGTLLFSLGEKATALFGCVMTNPQWLKAQSCAEEGVAFDQTIKKLMPEEVWLALHTLAESGHKVPHRFAWLELVVSDKEESRQLRASGHHPYRELSEHWKDVLRAEGYTSMYCMVREGEYANTDRVRHLAVGWESTGCFMYLRLPNGRRVPYEILCQKLTAVGAK